MKSTKHSSNSKAKKPAVKKTVAAKKTTPTKKAVVVKKAVTKKPSVKKPVAKKIVAKKVIAKNPVTKKAVPAKKAVVKIEYTPSEKIESETNSRLDILIESSDRKKAIIIENKITLCFVIKRNMLEDEFILKIKSKTY